MRKLFITEEQRKQRRRAQQLSAMSKNPEHYREYLRGHYRANWMRNALWRAKARAVRCGMEFALTLEDAPDVPVYCPVLGIKLEAGRVNGKHNPASPSLDRIDGRKGYVPGNVRIISYRANTLKTNATVAELRAVLQDLVDTGAEI